MHRTFQRFVEQLGTSETRESFRKAMAEAIMAFDLPCFAYLSMPSDERSMAALISTYSVHWTDYYLRKHYERLDPVILLAHAQTEPFAWGLDVASFPMSQAQTRLFDEAAQFGIRCGFTIPIQLNQTPVAAVTFASDEPRRSFLRTIEMNRRVLQLMAIVLHAHARRTFCAGRLIKGIHLSVREHECLHWAAQGKSRWETGKILNLQPRTVKFHLDNVRQKLGVCTVAQAICLMERCGTSGGAQDSGG